MAKRKKNKSFNKSNNIAEQSVGGYIDSEKVSRIAEMTKMIADTESRHTEALQEISISWEEVDQIIYTNRGYTTGMHGFIGESMQVHLSNAWDIIKNQDPIHILIDDNGMTDYFRDIIPIQQKACISDNCLGLTHILRHAKKYPEFDGIYQIPRDQYNLLVWYRNLSPDFAGKLSKAQYRQYLKVMKYLPQLQGKKIEPMLLSYEEIQAGKAFQTLDHHQAAIDRYYLKERNGVIINHRPSIKQCVKAAGISAGIQGGIKLISSTVQHTKDKDGFTNLDRQDLLEIGKDAAIETGKGAVHGAGVYALTNYTPGISTNTATAIMTFGVDSASMTYKYFKKEISGHEYFWCLLDSASEASVAALSAKIGRRLIPLPIIGELIGSTVGTTAFKLIKFAGRKCIVPMLPNTWKIGSLQQSLPMAA